MRGFPGILSFCLIVACNGGHQKAVFAQVDCACVQSDGGSGLLPFIWFPQQVCDGTQSRIQAACQMALANVPYDFWDAGNCTPVAGSCSCSVAPSDIIDCD